MSVSDKPWLADRQPSHRGGVPQVTTGPDDFGKREGPTGAGRVSDAMDAAPRTAVRRPQSRALAYATLFVADRAVDLLRVNSALCTAPGCARSRG